MTPEQIKRIVAEAHAAGEAAWRDALSRAGGVDGGACGFAWVNLYKYGDKKLDGRSRMGRALKAAGVERDWNGVYQIWNAGGYPRQSIDIREAANCAAAEVWRKHGFVAYAGSRLD
jgi:hypothetical protein